MRRSTFMVAHLGSLGASAIIENAARQTADVN